MRVGSRAIALVLAFTVIVPAGVFIGLYSSSQGSPGSTILRMGFAESIDSLNPFVGYNSASYVFYSLVYDSLTGVGGDMNPVPCLAKEWRIVPGELPYGSVWEYNLSVGAKWSDGVPVTAEDIAWAINLVASPVSYDSLWAFQPYSYYIDYAEAMDVDTLRIRFWDRMTAEVIPCAYGDSLLIPMLPKHVLEEMSLGEIGFSWDGTPVIGTGPFVPSPTLVDDWKAGNTMTLVRNPDYHGGPNYGRYVKFDKIEMHFFDIPSDMSAALESNEIDVASLHPDDFNALKDRVDLGLVPDVELFDGLRADGYWENVLINMNNDGPNPSRLDPTIRHAMAMATNKSYILEQFYMGEGLEGSTLMSSVSEWHYDLGLGEEYAYDLAAASALLEGAGYVDIDMDGIRECTSSSWAYTEGLVPLDTALTYEMLTRTNHPEEYDVARFLENEWIQIGVNLEISVVTEPVMAMIVYSYSYDTAIWYWSMDPDPCYILFTQSRASWNGWSDTRYSTPAFEENYTASVKELDSDTRGTYVDNCQRVHYQDVPYIILAYLNDTYAWRTDTFSGWGDWHAQPGRSVTACWSGNPLYFELVPQVEYNAPPGAVTIDADPMVALTGEPVTFTVNAMDPDGDDLSVYIEFDDGSSDQTMSSAPMYATHEVIFSHLYSTGGASYQVTAWVDDGSPGGNVSASVTVWVVDAGARTVDYRWHDLFNVSTGEFWDTRWAVYQWDEPLTSSYPYIFRTDGLPDGNDFLFSNMRLDVTGQEMPEINMNAHPEILPVLGTAVGGNAEIDWYMQYMVPSDYARYPGFIASQDDGWINILNGTTTLDRQASKTVMNLTDSDFDNFSTWWTSNEASFEQDYVDWLNYEGNDRLFIWYMYDWTLTLMYFDLEAQKVGETIVISYDVVAWGMECLMARWLHETFLPGEYYYEDFEMDAAIGPDSANLSISTVVEYASYAWETTLVPDGEPFGLPCWTWEASLGDFIPSIMGRPPSEFDPYENLEFLSKSPCSQYWHQYLYYDYTPTAWNLALGETLTFEWPAGDQLFYVHDDFMPLDPMNVSGPMSVRYSEPMETDFLGQIVNDQVGRTLTFVGPMDMMSWSANQIKHESLESEWDRLGVLPYGMPWVEFQIDLGLNTAPTALFGYDPEFGDITTTYLFDAGDSWDLEDPTSSLEVRWDWNGDGTYDTGWTSTKTASIQLATPGTYNVTLQVRDSQGLTDTKVIEVTVADVIPELPAIAFPLIAVALVLMISWWRRRRT